MRQGQQNRRGRGRSNNGGGHGSHSNQNRKGHNPLTRSFESNGPDVKLRGTPAHIAEKYITLARDAQSSGDPVLAENYLQHAEHYNRIIMTFREQQMQQGGEAGGGVPRPRPQGSDGDDFGDDDGDDLQLDASGQPIRGQEPQPSIFEGQPQPPAQPQQAREHQREHREHRGQRYDDRGPRRHGEQGGRPQRDNRDRFGEHREPREAREPREQREPREHREPREQREPPRVPVERPLPVEALAPEPAAPIEPAPRVERAAEPRPEGAPPPRRRERFSQAEQPEFLRRPVRRPRREAGNGDEPAAAPSTLPTTDDTPRE